MRIFLIFLVIANTCFAVEEIEDKYPFFRQFRSSFNITFGGVSLYKSIQVMNDDESSNTEKNYSYILTAIGAMRLADGLYYFFTPSLPEIYLKEGKLNKSSKNFKTHLNESRKFEKRLRKYRATVIFLNGVGFFGLYNEDPEKNKLSLYPGLGMMLVSAYAFWGKAPAEKAHDRLYGTPTVTFSTFKVNKKYSFMPVFNFRF